MNNFLDFINNDINVRRELLSSLPTKTKTNIKKYNETIDEFIKKYQGYEDGLLKYINAKEKSLKPTLVSKNIKEYKQDIDELKKVRRLFSNVNTYVEKLGFDTLLYRLSNYYVFNFDSIDSIIGEFIDKFEEANIKLDADDFNYTYYVHEYMKVFLDIKRGKGKTKEDLDKIFESIYWANPDLISHVELNFRKLLKKYRRKLEIYIFIKKREIARDYNINSYKDCLLNITDVFEKKQEMEKEEFSDIVKKALNNEFDVSQMLEDSKVRKSAYDSLIAEKVDINDEAVMNKIYLALDKLNDNLKEYSEYYEIMPLVDDFKANYAKLINTNTKESLNNLKNIENDIKKKESELEKINKKIFRSNFEYNDLKIDSVRRAKTLYDLYKKYDLEYFNNKVLSIISSNMSISDLIDLYFNFDQFKKINIQRVYELSSYNEVSKQSKAFDEFAMNTTNNIVKALPVFDDNDISRIIANKYKLDNIKLYESDIVLENINALSNKITLLTRINKINKNNMSIEQLWFLQKAHEIVTSKTN